jgi:hypothetical protein
MKQVVSMLKIQYRVHKTGTIEVDDEEWKELKAIDGDLQPFALACVEDEFAYKPGDVVIETITLYKEGSELGVEIWDI